MQPEDLTGQEWKQLFEEVADSKSGRLATCKHSKDAMFDRGINMSQVRKILKAGTFDPEQQPAPYGAKGDRWRTKIIGTAAGMRISIVVDVIFNGKDEPPVVVVTVIDES